MKAVILTLTIAGLTFPLPLYAQLSSNAVSPDRAPLVAATQTTVATGSLAAVPAHRHIRLAVYMGPGATPATSPSVAGDKIGKDPDITVVHVTPEDIRGGKLAGFDVLLQPGGSGHGQANALGPEGRDKICEFVRNGGGYLGICGGSYLASDDYPWSLGIINTKVVDKEHWARGHGPVDVAPNAAGKSVLGAKADHLTIIYWQGPIMAPKNDPKLPPYVEWAQYRTEVTRKGVPGGVMPGATAVAAASFGKGRVVCFGPHPERTDGQESLLQHAVLWLVQTDRETTPQIVQSHSSDKQTDKQVMVKP